MAKQIYIDGNGNEQIVSGTINNASMLPISASDSTNTKDYIDGRTASDIEYSSGVSVADELTKIGTTHQLLNQALTTTETSYNTVASRKFSDYDLLIFRIGYGADNIRRTVVMPTNNWYSGATINESILHGSSSGHASDYDITTIGVNFNSDTSVKASVGGEGLINTLKIYGVKL